MTSTWHSPHLAAWSMDDFLERVGYGKGVSIKSHEIARHTLHCLEAEPTGPSWPLPRDLGKVSDLEESLHHWALTG